ncbi:MAG: T9SS type A sorting domain-containing protein [Bacteroidetes bacterium]|nr:T9SS type A sorting domain-containing protein [Bacteroidota bacterium]
MKKIFFKCLLVVTIVNFTAKAQTMRCDYETRTVSKNSDANTRPTISNMPGFVCSSTINNYIPTASTDPLVYRLNIHLFKRTFGPGVYDNVTTADVNYFIYLLNQQYSTLQPPQLLANPVAPFISNSKITFVLNNIYWHTDDIAFQNNAYFNDPVIDAMYGVDRLKAFNIYFISDPINNGGAFGGSSYSFGTFIGSPTSMWFPGLAGLFGHELGHSFGWLDHTGGATAGGFMPPDVFFEPSGIWNVAGVCGTPNTSNNIMGYNWQCRNYLSPQQIGLFFYNSMAGGPYTANYPGIPGGNTIIYTTQCDYDNTKSITVSSNQTWTKCNNIRGDITINSGVELIIKCNINMTKDAKIYVNKGAKLTLDGGTISNYCGELWGGIEVFGDNTLPQYIDPTTFMPLYQGMVVLKNSAKIANAKNGVSLGQRNSTSGLFISGTGGGIVQANPLTTFENNIVDVDFLNYVYVDPTKPAKAILNVSYFKQTSFNANNSQMNSLATADTRVILYGVRSVKFLGCNFSGDGNYGIRSTNASFIIQDYCSTMTGGVCTGAIIQNVFNSGSFYYGIYASNSSNFWPSTIDHATFTGNYKTSGIYLGAVNSSKIANCYFNISNFLYPSSVICGAYLNGCTLYTIQNNVFYGMGSPVEGLIIQNSGTLANEVYNNTFTNLTYGLWAQRQNVNWGNGVGLKLNCNDFNNCDYNIGVQGPLTSNNQHGIAFTQGIENGTVQQNARNKYNTSACNTNGENKFYIDTWNTLYLYHGSFSATQFHPTPQTNASCSNASEIQDVFGTTIAPAKSVYCPSANPPVSENKLINTSQQQLSSINSNIDAARSTIKQLEEELTNSSSQKGKQNIESQLSLARTDLGLLLNKKINYLLNDESAENPWEEIETIFASGDMAEEERFLIISAIEQQDFSKATQRINQLRIKNNKEDNDFCDLEEIIIVLKNDKDYFYKVNSDGAMKAKLKQLADNEGPAQLGAVNILQKVAAYKYMEELLHPRIATSTSISQNQILFGNGIKVFPNPASNILNVEMNEREASEIQITDVTGKIILNQMIENKTTISVEKLINGIYFVNLVDKGKIISTKKIVIIK